MKFSEEVEDYGHEEPTLVQYLSLSELHSQGFSLHVVECSHVSVVERGDEAEDNDDDLPSLVEDTVSRYY